MEFQDNKESIKQQLDISLKVQEIKLNECLDKKPQQAKINEFSLKTFFLNYKTRQVKEVPFNPAPEIQHEHKVLLDCIIRLYKQTNEDFDQFLLPFQLKLISKFMELSKELSQVLKMKTINIKIDGSEHLLIHPSNSDLDQFQFEFHEKTQEMYEQGFLTQTDQNFIDFYNLIEDLKRQAYIDCGEFEPQYLPPTHTLTKQLYEIMNQNESERQPQKKKKIEDDIEIDIIQSLEDTMLCAIDFRVKMQGHNLKEMPSEKLKDLYKQITKLYEIEKDLNELIEKYNKTNPQKASYFKSFREFIFKFTFASSKIQCMFTNRIGTNN